MNIPFNDFKKEYKAFKKDVDPAVKRVLASGHYILGKEVENFERNFAKFVGAKHAIGVGNGMEALQIALMAIGVGKGDEVITSPLSAVATALGIKAVGATPVFADIDEYHHIDAARIEEKINSRTRAIMPVHLFGQAADIERISEIAKKNSLAIIEDCAQAHGSTYDKKSVGSFGIGCWSFYPTKNLGCYGDGGAVTTNDDALAEKMRMIRNYGQKNRYEHPVPGLNSRLDEIHAATLSVKLKKLRANNARRNKIANIYKKELGEIAELESPKERLLANHVYHLFVIKTEKRDQLREYLAQKGISTLVHYPIAIHKQDAFAEYNGENLPVTEERVTKILSLPCHPYLSDKEAHTISKHIRSFFGR